MGRQIGPKIGPIMEEWSDSCGKGRTLNLLKSPQVSVSVISVCFQWLWPPLLVTSVTIFIVVVVVFSRFCFVLPVLLVLFPSVIARS